MKKISYLIFIALMFFLSCKKEHGPVSSITAKKYKVVFNSNFTQKTAAFALRRQANSVQVNDNTASGNNFDLLYYYVYDATTDGFVHRIVQDSTMANFGTVTDSLPAGKYYVSMVIGKKGLVDSGNTGSNGYFGGSVGYGSYDWQDFFVGDLEVTVADTASDNQNVYMLRWVTKLEVELSDVIPANASSIKISVYPGYNASYRDYRFGGLNPDTARTTYNIPASAIGTSNFTFDKLLMPGNTFDQFNNGLDVTLTAYDASNHVIGTAHVPNVKSPPNQRTILSGVLFATNGNSQQTQNFNVKADTAWNSTPNQVSFSLRHH